MSLWTLVPVYYGESAGILLSVKNIWEQNARELLCVCEVQPADDKIKNKTERNAVSHKINYIQRSTKSKFV